MATGIKAQLPTNISLDGLQRLASDSDWGWQFKYNGDRRTVKKEAGHVQDFNRDGAPGKGLPQRIVDALLNHPLPQFLIDVEFVHFGRHDTIYVFDSLILGDEFVAVEPFEYREARYHAEFDNYASCIVPVFTARTPEEKTRMFVQAAQDGIEGIVAHKMSAAYEEGRSTNVFKFKFIKQLDAVCMGDDPKGKDSVRLGCYDEHGKLHEICGARIIDIHPTKGQVVEIRYNKGTKKRHVMEIHIERIRDDKKPRECTLDQIVVNADFRR